MIKIVRAPGLDVPILKLAASIFKTITAGSKPPVPKEEEAILPRDQ